MIEKIIGKKIGMTRIFLDTGEVVAVTAIEAGPCYVTQVKKQAKDGYNAIQLGFEKSQRLNAPQKGHLKRIGDNKEIAGDLTYLREFNTEDIEAVKDGERVDLAFLNTGDYVSIRGYSKGKGFAGVVKRYHFKGGPKTHGQSDRHRAPGSIGQATSPGRVFKGLHMAGHMGNVKCTVCNLKVVKVDLACNLLLVNGAVPGSRKSLLTIEKVNK
jgi:large subunit ribosomal protein L3